MMRTAPNPTLEEKDQYHHHIPRFVLRAFAARPQPSYGEPTRPVGKNNKNKNKNGGKKKKKKKQAKTAARDAEVPKG